MTATFREQDFCLWPRPTMLSCSSLRSGTASSTLSTPVGAGTGGVTVETQTASCTPLNRADRWEVRTNLIDNSDQHAGSTDVRGGEDGGASCWDIDVLTCFKDFIDQVVI